MDAQRKEQYEKDSQQLRAELKKWESKWAKEHNGSKPGRDDIKQDPEIGILRFS